MKCTFTDCGRDRKTAGLCWGHYKQKVEGRPLKELRKQGPKGEGSPNERGYIRVKVRGKMHFKHRMVMSEHLGRPLHPFETVHHKNGNVADNRLDNLELWVSKQPSGQRPEDLVAYAKEILELYDQ